MTFSFYDVATSTVNANLNTLEHLVSRAEASSVITAAAGEKPVGELRLAPDMLDFGFQIRFASEICAKLIARVHGEDAPTFPIGLTDVKTYEDIRTILKFAKEYVAKADKAKFEANISQQVDLEAGPYQWKMPAEKYFRYFSLPGIYFHVTTAYAILRNKGLDLGKLDFLTGHGMAQDPEVITIRGPDTETAK